MREIEKRDHERYAIKLSAKLNVLSDGDGRLSPGEITLKTKDISSGGAFFVTDNLLNNGILLDVDLPLPFPRKEGGIEKITTIRVKGEVVRSMPGGVAVRFVGQYQFTAG